MGAGASSDVVTKTEAMDCLGGEWDEAMETRFMYSADAKTGTVNRKAAQRVSGWSTGGVPPPRTLNSSKWA